MNKFSTVSKYWLNKFTFLLSMSTLSNNVDKLAPHHMTLYFTAINHYNFTTIIFRNIPHRKNRKSLQLLLNFFYCVICVVKPTWEIAILREQVWNWNKEISHEIFLSLIGHSLSESQETRTRLEYKVFRL